MSIVVFRFAKERTRHNHLGSEKRQYTIVTIVATVTMVVWFGTTSRPSARLVETKSMPPRRKLVAPAARLQANTGLRWIESFIDYLRSECHLAENSVMAYQTRFGEVSRLAKGSRRDFAHHPRPFGLHGGAARSQACASQHCATHCGAADVFSVSSTGRNLEGQSCRTARQPEAVGTSPRGTFARDGRTFSGRGTRSTRTGGAIARCSNCCTRPAAEHRRSRT